MIFKTHLHLAKSHPSALYCAQRSPSPSNPVQDELKRCRPVDCGAEGLEFDSRARNQLKLLLCHAFTKRFCLQGAVADDKHV